MKSTTAVVILNVALIASFTACAIYFNKWWIVLFVIIAAFSAEPSVKKGGGDK